MNPKQCYADRMVLTLVVTNTGVTVTAGTDGLVNSSNVAEWDCYATINERIANFVRELNNDVQAVAGGAKTTYSITSLVT